MKTPAKIIEPELISLRDTLTLCGGRSRQWIYVQLRRDATFPRPVRTNPHRTEFRKSELLAWIEGLPRAELDGVDAITRRQQAKRD